MAGLTALITAISNDVVAKIAAAGLPPLVDGGIVLGKSRQAENSAPPRVIFIPKSFRWGPASPGTNASAINPRNPSAPGAGVRSYTMTQYGGGYGFNPPITISAPDVAGGIQAAATATVTSNGAISRIVPSVVGSGYLNPPTVTIGGTGTLAAATANLGPTPQALAVLQQRSLLTEWHMFEVHVWGAYSTLGVLTPDSDLDYDATQQLYQQVIASTHSLAAGVHMESAGSWADAEPTATVIDVLGHKVEFMMEIATPLLAEPIPAQTGASVQLAPAQTQPNPTTTLVPFSGGSAETP